MPRSWKHFIVAMTCLTIPVEATAQIDLSPTSPYGRALRVQGLRQSRAHATTAELADSIGSRLSGSPNMRRAYTWAMAKLKSIGARNVHLEDAGDFGLSWYQERVSLRMTSPDRHMLMATAVPWSGSSRGTIHAAAVAADISSTADFAVYRGKLRGRIVFLGRTPPSPPPVDPFSRRLTDQDVRSGAVMADVRRYYRRRPARLKSLAAKARFGRALGSFLEEERVAGVVLPTSSAGAGGTGLLTTDDSDAPGGRLWVAAERLHFPMLRTTKEDFGRVQRLLTAGSPVQLELSAETKTVAEHERLFNVVADLPGSDAAGEYVLAGAHLDSWIGGTGATDDGAGVGIVIEAARLLAQTVTPLRRTVKIVLYSGEEQGLFGSAAFAKAHLGTVAKSEDPDEREIAVMQWRTSVAPPVRGPDYDKLSIAFNVDAGSGRFRALATGGRNPRLAAVLAAWLPSLSDLGLVQVYDEPDWPADQVTFSELNLPGLSIVQDPLDYGTRAHHTNMDTVERLDAEDLARSSTALAVLLAQSSNNEGMLPRPEPYALK